MAFSDLYPSRSLDVPFTTGGVKRVAAEFDRMVRGGKRLPSTSLIVIRPKCHRKP